MKTVYDNFTLPEGWGMFQVSLPVDRSKPLTDADIEQIASQIADATRARLRSEANQ